MKRNLILAALLCGAGVGAFAQNAEPSNTAPATTASTVQRDLNQDRRIRDGLQDGSLTTREAASLERDQSKIDRLQAKALKDGKLSPAEREQLTAAQDRASRHIKRAESNGYEGHPASASSQRMQNDVQRNINQDKRLEAGVQNGSLTNHEVAAAERGQADVHHEEAVAGRDGHVGAAEHARVQQAENRQSRKIHREKHDEQDRKS